MPQFLRTPAARRVAAPLVLTIALGGVFGSALSASASAQAPVGLGTADSYEVLAASTVTNTGATAANNGDVGLSPGTSVTGFPPAVIANGVIHATDAQAQQAQIDLTTAYNDAAGRPSDATVAADLGGQTFTAGVYTGNALALNGTVTLNGSATDVFIFQAASTLITGSASTVAFTGGANSCNVYWQVGSSATIGSGSAFAGTVLAQISVTADTAATIDGRLLTRTGAVTLDSNVITRPASCAARSAIEDSTPTAEQVAAAAPTPAPTTAAPSPTPAPTTAAPTPTATPTPTRVRRTATPTPTATAAANNQGTGSDDTTGNSTTTIELARTGVDIAPVATGSVVLLLVGSVLLAFAFLRRRSARS